MARRVTGVEERRRNARKKQEAVVRLGQLAEQLQADKVKRRARQRISEELQYICTVLS